MAYGAIIGQVQPPPTLEELGGVPETRTVNGFALSSDITLFTYGTTDITAGSPSTEPEGSLHLVIE